jgi:glycyl-tRNA synthetase beta chain
VPTGDKDPFGLRRAALGVVRILAEKHLPLDLVDLLTLARSYFGAAVAESVAQDLHGFALERLKPYLKEKGFETDEIEAVVSLGPRRLDHVMARMKALQEFRVLPEAQALAAANKRIRNILRQAGGEASVEVDSALLTETAEIQLAMGVKAMDDRVRPLLAAFDYAEALKQLASLRPAVDEFFDRVMVMADDKAVRHNRLALLNRLSGLFLNVADISRLQA